MIFCVKMSNTSKFFHRRRIEPNSRPTGSFRPDIRDHHEKRLVFLWAFICAIGLLIHSVNTTIEYLRYGVTSEVSIQFEEDFIPPAVSFCFDTVTTRVRKSFESTSNCSNHLSFKQENVYCSCEKDMLENLTLKEIFNKHTIDLIQMVDKIQVKMAHSYVRTEIKNRSELDKYLNQFMRTTVLKCIRFQYPNVWNQTTGQRLIWSMDMMSRFENTKKYFFQSYGNFKLLDDDIVYVLIFIHDHDTHPRGHEMQAYESRFFKGSEGKFLTYQKIEKLYLPAPFFSKCTKSYKPNSELFDFKIESRNHCIERCIKKLYKEIYPDYISPSSTYRNFQLFNTSKKSNPNESFSIVHDLYQECRTKCQLDCITNIYLPQMSFDYGYEVGTFRLDVKNDNPVIRIKFMARESFYQYIIYLSSIFGFWFGLSIYQLMKESTSSIATHCYNWKKGT